MKKCLVLFMLAVGSLIQGMEQYGVSPESEKEPLQTYILQFTRTVNGKEYYLYFQEKKKGPFDVGEYFTLLGHSGKAVFLEKQDNVIETSLKALDAVYAWEMSEMEE